MNHLSSTSETSSKIEDLRVLTTHTSGRQNREVWTSPINSAISANAMLLQEPRYESAIIGTIEIGRYSTEDLEIISTFRDILLENPTQPCVIFVPVSQRNSVDDLIARCPELWEIATYPNVRLAHLSRENPIFALFGCSWNVEWDHRYFKDSQRIDKNSLLGYLDHGWWNIDRNNITETIIRENPTVRSLIQQAKNVGIQGDDQAIVRQIRGRKADETYGNITEIEPEQHGTLNTLCIDWDGTLFGEMRNESPINIDMLDEALEKAQEHKLSLTIWTGGGWETIQKIYATPELKQYFEKYPWLHVVHKSDCRGWTIPHVYDDSTTEELQTTYWVTIQNHHGLWDMHGQVARNIERQRQAVLKQLPT